MTKALHTLLLLDATDVENQISMKMHSYIKKAAKDRVSSRLLVTLCDTRIEMCSAWLQEFSDTPNVAIAKGDLTSIEADAWLAPANSFGDMGGGLDQSIDNALGRKAQPCVIEFIAKNWCGELPVGTAEVLEITSAKSMQKIVVAPTMRIPGLLPHGINAYLSMRAALVAIWKHNSNNNQPIRSIAIPGLCTGVGGMSFAESATQMKRAYQNIAEGEWVNVAHPSMAPYALHPEKQ